MVVELEIEENPNVDEYECRSFMGRGKALPVSKVLYFPDEAEPYEVEIVGWEDNKQVQAYALCVEDSGDGEAWLIYGGNEGIRIRKSSSEAKNDFSLENKEEWGEKYFYYHKNLYEKAIKPYLNDAIKYGK